jgi:hypothetical protein
VIKTVETAATLLGLLVRSIWLLILSLPQLAGFGLLIYGVWLFDYRAALILTGIVLLALSGPRTRPKDRREK